MNSQNIQNIDQYIAMNTPQVQELLEQIRTAISQVAPTAIESIKYAMPTFEYYGNLVHFSACKSHIGFYPAPSGIVAFSNQLSQYKCTKGAIQFPFTLPLPINLIKEIVIFRMNENHEKSLKMVRKKTK